MIQPVFMVGEQRSGSNLLRLMLNQSPELAGPHPPHILQRFMPLVPGYGDLEQDRNFLELVDDVCELVERNPVPWEGMESIDRAMIAARSRERSLIGVFGALMDTFAELQGKSMWICKSMTYIRYAEALDACFGSPKYVYLHRDGRDVALSFMKAVVGEKHPWAIASAWAELQAICIAERERIGPERFFTVAYEQLTADPEGTLRDLCGFLGIEYQASMTEFGRSAEAKRTAQSSSLWSNVTKPVMSDNSQKFRSQMDEDTLRIVESVAGAQLDALGYERALVPKGHESPYGAEEVEAFRAENRRLKAARAAEVEPEDRARRDHQLEVLARVRRRHEMAPR